MLVIATANPHKVEELSSLFALHRVPLRLLSLAEAATHAGIAIPKEPDEVGRTFEANCAIKALAYSSAFGLACLADDSGLEVDAMHGAPGVDSSHFAMLQGEQSAEHATSRGPRDAANLRLVLQRMQGVPRDRRTARFVCCMTIALKGKVLVSVRGTMEGAIGEEPRVPSGSNGFGYDPIFLVAPGFARTGAELSPQEKNALSHRARAAEQIARFLRATPLC
jgi:XTP/dITP diphosphohydrolase